MKKPNTKSMGQEFPWESHILPLPFPCLTTTTNSRVCSNNPSFTWLWSLSSQQTIAWMLRKENGWGVTCMFDFPPCIISPPAEVQGETLWNRSADLVSFSSVAASSLVGHVPTSALASPLVGASVTGCLSCSGMWVDEPVTVVFWQQGLYVQKGQWQCVWLKLQ